MRTEAFPGRRLVARILREPLVHFLLIGLAVFAFYRGDQRPLAVDVERVIEVTPTQVERLSGQFASVWRRPPTEEELAGLVEDFVREEVYYREALALGLDQDDTVIRRRLRQKMEFLGDAGAGAMAPEESVLLAHFEAHPERFTPPARVTFRQVFLGDGDPGLALAALEEGADPDEIGGPTLLPPVMEAGTRSSVDGAFGSGFFQAVSSLDRLEWRGPVMSSFGAHLVQLLDREPAATPSFEAVKPAVEADWRREAADTLREAQFRAMRERYEVILPAEGG